MERKRMTLALQGGGSHGAFTWGVLDRLLEDERIDIEGISGAVAAHITGTGTPASPGIVTNGWSPYGDTLQPNTQAAWNSGENRSGDLLVWTDIVPIGNSFSLVCSNWTVATPAGAGNTTYCYAFGAIQIEEVSSAPSAPAIVRCDGSSTSTSASRN